jgi:hypothetical protein
MVHSQVADGGMASNMEGKKKKGKVLHWGTSAPQP